MSMEDNFKGVTPRTRYWRKRKTFYVPVRMDEDLYQALVAEAARTGRTVSDVIRRAITRNVMDKAIIARQFLEIDDGRLDNWELEDK